MATAYDPRGATMRDGAVDRELPSVSVCVGDFRMAINRLRQALGSGPLPSIHKEKVHSMRAMLHTLHCASLQSNWVHSAMANDFARGLAALSELEQLQRHQNRHDVASPSQSPYRGPNAAHTRRNKGVSDSDENSDEEGEGHVRPVMPGYAPAAYGGGAARHGGSGGGYGYGGGQGISDALLAAQHALALLVVHYCESLRLELTKCQERCRVAAEEGDRFHQRLAELQLALDDNQAVMVSLAAAHADKQAAMTRSEKEAQQLNTQLATTRKAMEYYSALAVALRAEVASLRPGPGSLAPILDGVPLTATQVMDTSVLAGSNISPDQISVPSSHRMEHSPPMAPRHLETDLGQAAAAASAAGAGAVGTDAAGQNVVGAVLAGAEVNAGGDDGELVFSTQRTTWGDSESSSNNSTPDSVKDGLGAAGGGGGGGGGGDKVRTECNLIVSGVSHEVVSPALPPGEQLDRVTALRPVPLPKLRLTSLGTGLGRSVGNHGVEGVSADSADRGSQTARPAISDLRAEDAVARARELLAALPSDALDLIRQYARDAWDAATQSSRQLASAPVTSRNHPASGSPLAPGTGGGGAFRRHTTDSDAGTLISSGVGTGAAGGGSAGDAGGGVDGVGSPRDLGVDTLVGLRALIVTEGGVQDGVAARVSVDDSPTKARDQHPSATTTTITAAAAAANAKVNKARVNDTVATAGGVNAPSMDDTTVGEDTQQQQQQQQQQDVGIPAAVPVAVPQPVQHLPMPSLSSSRAMVLYPTPTPLRTQLMQSVRDVCSGVSQVCKGWLSISYGLWSMSVAVPWWAVRSLARNTQAGALGHTPWVGGSGRGPAPGTANPAT